MSDRELLELAAKAAGIKGSCDSSSALRCVDESGKITYWNPLEDDGDSLRLALKMRLEVDFDHSVTAVRTRCGHKILDKDHKNAIVRAVAEIGRNMT